MNYIKLSKCLNTINYLKIVKLKDYNIDNLIKLI